VIFVTSEENEERRERFSLLEKEKEQKKSGIFLLSYLGKNTAGLLS
jgi:hypothetical protein